MNNVSEYNDLCISCNYTSLCTKRKNLKRPIWYCEEFDDFTPASRESVKVFKHNKSNSSFADINENPIKYRGICSNCIIRDICLFPKPENGVWHCEEYQ